MVTSQNLGGEPKPGADAPSDKEARAKELGGMKKAELQEILGVDETDDRTKEELQKAILAVEFQRPSQAQADAEDAPQAPQGAEKQPQDLMSPNDPRAGLDRQHRAEVNRTKQLLDQQPKKTLYLPQRAANDKRGLLPNVFVQINDYTYNVPRGQAVEVPEEVYRIVVDAGHMIAD